MNISFANTEKGKGIAFIFKNKAYSVYFHNKNYWKSLRLFPAAPFIGFQNRKKLEHTNFFNKRAFYLYPFVLRKHSELY